MKKRIEKSDRLNDFISSIKRILLCLILTLFSVLIYKSYTLFNKKNNEYANKMDLVRELEAQIDAENSKAKKLDRQNDNVTTNDEIEAIARQELGLIKRDEILIRPK